MSNSLQQDRYLALLDYIDKNLALKLSSEQVERISLYSYRNMNRIFRSRRGETIGRHIKRRRLEKAAEFLIYTSDPISTVCYSLGFEDLAVFSKAFKNQFGYSPTQFREQKGLITQPLSDSSCIDYTPLDFEESTIGEFDYFFKEYHGPLTNLFDLQKLWNDFLLTCQKYQIATDDSTFFGTILDDNEITEDINCRYRACVVIDKNDIESEDIPLRRGRHTQQSYLRFIHIGDDALCEKTYSRIYGQWMSSVKREFVDAPVLEFYYEQKSNSPNRTEIYIPIK